MSVYLYKAQNIDGIKLKGKIECNDEKALYLMLKNKGFYLINYKKDNSFKIRKIFRKITKKELSILCKQLSTILSCGINITEALQLLSVQKMNPILKANIIQIRNQIEKGESLADSFEIFKKNYPVLMINMIRVGEEGGNLDIVFNSLSEYFEKENQIAKKIKAAMAYPIMLFAVTILVILILMLKIVPSFAATLNGMGQKIPMSTSVIISESLYLRHNLLQVLLMITLMLTVIRFIIKSKKYKSKMDRMLLDIPLVGGVYKKYIENRFIGCMSILLESGNTVFNSLQLSKLCTENSVIKKQILDSTEEIMKGKSTLDALKKIEVIDSVTVSMIDVGENTGTLSEMVKKSGEIIDEELKIKIDKFTSLLGPSMIIILAIIIGITIFSIMMPILNIMDSIK